MSLPQAIEIADELRDELLLEIDRARTERELLRSFDAAKIHGRLQEREAFLCRARQLEQRLVDATDGHAQVSLQLDQRIQNLRSLAGTLSELTALNHELARRAANCARAYVHALTPRAASYDRRGASRAAAVSGALSRRA